MRKRQCIHSELVCDFGVLVAKYLYIHDDKITGAEDNNKAGTASSGITYNTAGYVLRYVIGV